MATDYYLVLGKDLKRLGTRGSRFHWLVDPTLLDERDNEAFEVWDDFANEYTLAEFEAMLANIEQTVADDYPSYPSTKVDYPNGTEDDYWQHKTPESKYRDMYKARVTGVQP